MRSSLRNMSQTPFERDRNRLFRKAMLLRTEATGLRPMGRVVASPSVHPRTETQPPSEPRRSE